MSVFDGEFLPPTMARTTVPIAIVGAGSVELADQGLKARGLKRQNLTGLYALLVLAVVATFVGGLILLSTLGLGSKTSGYLVVAACFLVGGAGAQLLRAKQKAASTAAGQTLELAFDWAQVKKAAPDVEDPSVVVIHVKRSLLNTESLHFSPAGGRQADLVSAVQQRLG